MGHSIGAGVGVQHWGWSRSTTLGLTWDTALGKKWEHSIGAGVGHSIGAGVVAVSAFTQHQIGSHHLHDF